MAPNDAEMPDHYALRQDLAEIVQRLSGLRQAVDDLTGSVGLAGSHQTERLQDQATEAVNAIEDAVRRDPFTSLGVALGIGFLIGLLLRR